MKKPLFNFFSVILIFLGGLCCVYNVILHFLSPGTFLDILTSFSNIWIILGLILIFTGIFRFKKNRSLFKSLPKILKIIIVFFVSLIFIISSIYLPSILNPEIAENNFSCDYVFLLGGGIDKNGNLPEPVKSRVEKCAKYLKKNQNAIVVVTGGTLKWLPYAEAPAIKNLLKEKGITENRIFIEDKSLDTIQNLQNGVKILCENLNKSTDEILNSKNVIVSNFYHLSRAQKIARRLGFKNVSGIGASTPKINVPISYVREICAHLKLDLRILFTQKPAEIL